jgi:hypothetical protein
MRCLGLSVEQSGNVVTALVGLLGAAIGAAASYFTMRQIIVSKYNTAIHKKRIEAYVILWEITSYSIFPDSDTQGLSSTHKFL